MVPAHGTSRRYHNFVPGRVWIFWILFLIRGSFYSAMLPLWEGWDEYAHFAWLQHWNDRGTLPVAADRVSREIDESMRLAPLPRELRWMGPPYLTHDQWWALSDAERAARVAGLVAIPPAWGHEPAVALGKPMVFYEAQQPPLYYWIAGAAMRPMGQWPLSERVLLIRLLGVLFTSLAIPFTFLAARQCGHVAATVCHAEGAETRGDRREEIWAVGCAALLAVAPGLAIDSARVANDGLAIGLAAAFLWLMTRHRLQWLPVGIVLGAGMLAKASLLVLAPVLTILWIRREWKKTAFALAVGIAIGGWWYARNVVSGLPLTGWQESVPLGPLVASALHLIRNGGWLSGAQTVAKSFTWFGAWSFMTLRTWMYVALEGCAFAGMIAGIAFHGRRLQVPLVFVGCFALAIAGGAAAYNAVHGIPGIPGWYLWPAGGAMAILIAGGLGRFTAVFVAMLAAADLFGAAARMMPYYSGLAPWNHGSVMQLPEAAARLHVSLWMTAAWVLATVAIPVWVAADAWLVQGRANTRM